MYTSTDWGEDMAQVALEQIAENVKRVRAEIAEAAIRAGRDPAAVQLVAATKMNDAQRVRAAVAAGVDACGENRVQELRDKLAEDAYRGAPLHLIGHLQRNKLKYVVGVCDLIQSADSEALLLEMDALAQKRGVVQNVLLEVNIAGEASKTGMSVAELPRILELAETFTGVSVRGLMAIPPISDVPGGNRPVFAQMQQLFVDIGQKKYNNVHMEILSMGMSGDYVDAVLEGATMVRVGSALFGARDYTVK